jgi:hypothetical protein
VFDTTLINFVFPSDSLFINTLIFMFMNVIVKDSTIKKIFDRGNSILGKYSDAIESIALGYFSDQSVVCDLIAITSHGNDNYVLLVLTNQIISTDFRNKLSKHISDFIPTQVLVLITYSQDCSLDDVS